MPVRPLFMIVQYRLMSCLLLQNSPQKIKGQPLKYYEYTPNFWGVHLNIMMGAQRKCAKHIVVKML